MFSRDELLRHTFLPGNEDDLPLLEVAQFHPYQFREPQPGRIVAHRGDKADFSSALAFWLWSQYLVDRPTTAKEFLHLAEETLCEPISAQDYFEMVDEFTATLKQPAPAFLRRQGSFLSGMRVFAGAFLKRGIADSVLAEFRDDFVAFHSRLVD